MSQTIYQIITENLTSGGYLPKDFNGLPDCEEVKYFNGGISLAPGEFDGKVLRSPAKIMLPAFINFRISRIIRNQIKSPTEQNRLKTLALFQKHHAIGIVDPIISFIEGSVDKAQMRQEAIWLASSTSDREAVKMGIALLGQCGISDDCNILRTLGCHEEFTLFAIVSLRKLVPNEANEIIFSLAQNLNGWGKISCVLDLTPSSSTIRDWLLRHGCSNSVGLSYIACTCAENSNLSETIEAQQIDPEFFAGATDIMSGLLIKDTSTNDGFDEYPEAKRAANAYLRHAKTMCSNEFERKTAEMLEKVVKY